MDAFERARRDSQTESRGRQRSRHVGSPVSDGYPGYGEHGPHDLDIHGPLLAGCDLPYKGIDREDRHKDIKITKWSTRKDGSGMKVHAYEIRSPQPSSQRERFHSPDYNTETRGRGRSSWAGHRRSSCGSFEREPRTRHQSPSPKRYAPRSTASGNLSFGEGLHSSMSSLSLGPAAVGDYYPSRSTRHGSSTRWTGHRSPIRESSTTDFYAPSMISYRSAYDSKIHEAPSFTNRDSSASRNALHRVGRSEYRHERESPREAIQRTMMNSRVPEHARVPDRAIPVEDVRQRGMERYHNADGFPDWYEQNLRHAQPTEAQRDRESARKSGGRSKDKRVKQQGFRKWYWGI